MILYRQASGKGNVNSLVQIADGVCCPDGGEVCQFVASVTKATVGAIYVEYLRDFYPIDFNDPLTDIPITQRNVQGILEEALRVTGNMQREFDYANQITNENIINNQ